MVNSYLRVIYGKLIAAQSYNKEGKWKNKVNGMSILNR